MQKLPIHWIQREFKTGNLEWSLWESTATDKEKNSLKAGEENAMAYKSLYWIRRVWTVDKLIILIQKKQELLTEGKFIFTGQLTYKIGLNSTNCYCDAQKIDLILVTKNGHLCDINRSTCVQC